MDHIVCGYMLKMKSAFQNLKHGKGYVKNEKCLSIS